MKYINQAKFRQQLLAFEAYCRLVVTPIHNKMGGVSSGRVNFVGKGEEDLERPQQSDRAARKEEGSERPQQPDLGARNEAYLEEERGVDNHDEKEREEEEKHHENTGGCEEEEKEGQEESGAEEEKDLRFDSLQTGFNAPAMGSHYRFALRLLDDVQEDPDTVFNETPSAIEELAAEAGGEDQTEACKTMFKEAAKIMRAMIVKWLHVYADESRLVYDLAGPESRLFSQCFLQSKAHSHTCTSSTHTHRHTTTRAPHFQITKSRWA